MRKRQLQSLIRITDYKKKTAPRKRDGYVKYVLSINKDKHIHALGWLYVNSLGNNYIIENCKLIEIISEYKIKNGYFGDDDDHEREEYRKILIKEAKKKYFPHNKKIVFEKLD